MRRRTVGWRVGLIIAGTLVSVVGCGRKSSILLERQVRGPIQEEAGVAQRVEWVLEPRTQTKTQAGVDVSVTYASRDYLREFFSNKEVFGGYAGINPFFPEQIVFYVKIANHSGKKLRLDPTEFVMLDDKGNQYHVLPTDYTTALAEAKAPMATMTRGVLEDARPGYFGVGLPVGKIFGKPQRQFALLAMSGLQPGYLYDSVVYDGLIAFWSLHHQSALVKLVLGNLKTDFNANDWPQTTLEFPFEFTASRQTR